MQWVLASGNVGKLAEMRDLLAGRPIELSTLADFDVDGPAETGVAFVDNALIKARHAASATGRTAIADDSGLAVDALVGAPGIHSARYAGVHGDDHANNVKLLAELDAIDDGDRTAVFHCTIAVCRRADDPAPLIAQGVWRGRILREPRGTNGFGYDSLFVDPASRQTAAEMDHATKQRASHRGRAMRRLVELLDD